jgi:hypothetical protein
MVALRGVRNIEVNMKPRNLWPELRIAAIAIADISLLGVAGFAAIHGEHDGGVYETRPKLPAEATARHVLRTTPRHIEWVAAPFGPKRILAFVVSPERSDWAPVAIVTAHNEGASDWARAVADRVAEAGFIAVVPDELTGEGPSGGDTDSFRDAGAVQSALARLGTEEVSRRIQAVRRFALASPASNGIGAQLDIRRSEGFISAAVQVGAIATAGKFALSDVGFAAVLAFLRRETNDHPVFGAQTVQNEHAMHLALLAKAANKTGETGNRGSPEAIPVIIRNVPISPPTFTRRKRPWPIRNSAKNSWTSRWAKSSSTPGSNIPRFEER